MKLKTFLPDDIIGKKVLVRVDFNVPLADGKVADSTRICAHLPTLRALKAAGAKVALISHLGRPKGKIDLKYSLEPVGEELAKITGWNVRFVHEWMGPEVQKASLDMNRKIWSQWTSSEIRAPRSLLPGTHWSWVTKWSRSFPGMTMNGLTATG